MEELYRRRSIRKYTYKEVKDEDILEIIKAGTYAPSAYHKQPWSFTIIKEKAITKNLATFLANYNEKKGRKSLTPSIIEKAPVVVLIYNNETIKRDLHILSLGAMIENMLLKATSLNIGSLWVGVLNDVREEVNNLLPKDGELISAVILGHTEETPVMPKRKDLENLIEWR
jgi:Nitroreductase